LLDQAKKSLAPPPGRAAPWIIATIALVLGLALVLGQVALAPKWTSFFWLWAATNLF
jgi:hypothetical protein